MSNPLAIAAVTATLRNLLLQGASDDPELAGIIVSTQPVDRARINNSSGNLLNLYLFQTVANAAWRNMDMPSQVKSGEMGHPPLALDLHYLITAYGSDDNDVLSHRILGRAMSILHDHPLLGPQEIRAALPDNDLHEQKIERVRITPRPMSLEEMSKLWSTFQTQYRISAAYQAAVVLIESRRAVKAALPVLRRGGEDQGVTSQAVPSPIITEVRPPVPLLAAQLGDDIIIHGQHLDSGDITVRFSSLHLPDPIELAPLPGGNEKNLTVHLPGTGDEPDALARWIPGFYTLSLVVSRPNFPLWTTNEVPVALAPTISISPISTSAGDVTLTITCTPRLRQKQRVLLLFGEEHQVQAQTITTPEDTSLPTTLTFLIPAVKAETYLVRLRIDGVDSLPFVRIGTPPRLEFDDNQKVTVHE